MEIEALNGLSVESSDASASGTSESSDSKDTEEINSIFSACQHVYCQSLGSKYILHVSATSETNPTIAAGLSDYSCDIFNLSGSQVAKIGQLEEHTNKLINCRFSPRSNNLLYTASSDGTAKLWDLRELKESAATFTDTTLRESYTTKALCSFDVSPCDRLLAAGTELICGHTYILFWDIRNTKLLGAYWESHTDDITQVKFHPEDSNRLMSGATDGLINIYNLTENTENDAFQECLNTEAFVEELQWFNEKRQWKISCITSANELQLWECDGAEPYKQFSRAEIAAQIKKGINNTYIAKALPVKESLLVLSGSNKLKGKSLQSLQISNGEVSPAFQFIENKQRVRASWINEHTSLLLTGGEKGQLDIWKPDLSVLNFKTSKRK